MDSTAQDSTRTNPSTNSWKIVQRRPIDLPLLLKNAFENTL